MSTISIPAPTAGPSPAVKPAKRVASIDLLRGIVMIIMVIDHTRDYFHQGAFLFNPEDLSRTTPFLFFTRWITHFCAPVFVFLAGASACLYGAKKGRAALSYFLFSRGLWLIAVELIFVSFFRQFDLSFHYVNLQVIWAIGIGMIILSALVYLNNSLILFIGLFIIATHNLLDPVHVPGTGPDAFCWAFLHEPQRFMYGQTMIYVHYPVLPWIGIMATGYCCGLLYKPDQDAAKRRRLLLYAGSGAILLFIALRAANIYGDAAHWSVQKNTLFSIFSFLNVTKYPPSLLYTLMTLGPALIFLAGTEKSLPAWTSFITVFGRVPMFFYLAHILLIHLLAIVAAMFTGHKFSDMVFTTSVLQAPQLKGYGFNLLTVYIVWGIVVIILYPCCKWFDGYKRKHQATQWWLSYL